MNDPSEHVPLGGKIDLGIEEKQRQSQGRDQGEYKRRLFALKHIMLPKKLLLSLLHSKFYLPKEI